MIAMYAGPMPLPRALLALLTVPAFVLAACGGPAPTREEFAAEANRVCTEAQQEVEQQARENPNQPPEQALDQASDQLRGIIDDLRGLERPEGEPGEMAERYVDGLEQQLDRGLPVLERFQKALESRDRQAIQRAAREAQALQGQGAELRSLANRLGLNKCQQ